MSYYLNAMKNYATFSGRASRTEFWMFILIFMGILFVAVILDVMTMDSTGDDVGLFTFIVAIAHFIPNYAILVRRIHDTNHSAWFLLLCIFFPFAALVFALLDSTPGDNRFGPNPAGNKHASNNAIGDMEKLEKAAALRQSGALTDEEFSSMKKKLLNV